jgi:tyrosyl-DNA phosphodiesterase 2
MSQSRKPAFDLKSILSRPASDVESEPRPQLYHKFTSAGIWEAVDPKKGLDHGTKGEEPSFKRFRLLTWNVDVLVPFGEPRMASALNYLQKIFDEVPKDQPVVLFLQEMSKMDLEQIQNTQWIRDRFFITDPGPEQWRTSSFYGTTTLVDKRLRMHDVFRVYVPSRFDRDAFFVDVQLNQSSSQKPSLLRLCNLHLESLVADPPLRPKQLEIAAKVMHDDTVYASVAAGDCNAIQPFDRTLHAENDLKDAYLETGGKEDNEDGYTWGYQSDEATMKRFGPSRMDKVLFCGNLEIKSLERIGIGVKVEDEEVAKQMREAYQPEFVTDHYGLMAEFELVGAALPGAGGSSGPANL